eukprot:TRINITY_DN222_c0_g1_i1.p1 TRINITY_DN222_c0_g1~~TRINITY_DN222_c0_g1_i1.p1  ORF type:complete len:690 (+),score=68.72 TRINITY_DN222_c0_g1_i1:522-2591(+)
MRTRTFFLIVLLQAFYFLRPRVLGDIDDSERPEDEPYQAIKKISTEVERTPSRGYLQEGICYSVKAHNCKTGLWSRNTTESLLVGSEGLRVRVEKGLAGNNTITIVVCESNPHYVVHDGETVFLSRKPDVLTSNFSDSASFIPYDSYFNKNYFALQTTSGGEPGRFIVNRGRSLLIEEVSDNHINPYFKHNVTWMFQAEMDSDPDSPRVHILESPVDASVKLPPPVFDDEFCHREHKGCCTATETRFISPTENALGPYPGHDVTVLVVSSFNTLAARKPLLVRWLVNGISQNVGPWKRAVITLDCYSHDIDTSWPMTDWLVGPSFDLGSPKGIAVIAIRVNIALHWMMLNHRDSAFYFMVDDDTLVFSNHMTWALSYLYDPFTTLWYVGGGPEWRVKMHFHGNMAFGGGGVLISNYAGKMWLEKYPGAPENATRSWLLDGSCSHEGGDGSFCRCLRQAAGSSAIFSPFDGFHQFDTVGTAGLLYEVRDTCPNCPSLYEMTGVWFDDIVGRTTLITFHHLLAIERGSIYPGATGDETTEKLMEAYDTHPTFMLARRSCGISSNGTFTLCVNFGHRLQIFRKTLPPEEAMILLDTSDGSGRWRPRTKLIRLGIRQIVQEQQMCSLTYEGAIGEGKYLYKGNRIEPRPAHDGGCKATAIVTLSGTQLYAHIDFAEIGQYIVWHQSLFDILPP